MNTFSIKLTVTAVLLALSTINILTCEGKVTPREALAATVNLQLPDGIVLTGTVEPIQEPKVMQTKEVDAADNKEFLGDGGYGRFGCNRFGFSYHGFNGWAYPLNYWNAYGSGIYGGSCGLGMSYGSLYYC